MVEAVVLQLGERVAGDDAAHAAAADGQRFGAGALGDGTADRLGRDLGVVLDVGVALAEADQDDVEATGAELVEEARQAVLVRGVEVVEEGGQVAGAVVEAVGEEERLLEVRTALRVVDGRRAGRVVAGERPGRVGLTAVFGAERGGEEDVGGEGRRQLGAFLGGGFRRVAAQGGGDVDTRCHSHDLPPRSGPNRG